MINFNQVMIWTFVNIEHLPLSWIVGFKQCHASHSYLLIPYSECISEKSIYEHTDKSDENGLIHGGYGRWFEVGDSTVL